MNSIRTIVIGAAMATFCVTGYAQTPVEHDTHLNNAAPTGNMSMPVAGPNAQFDRIDKQMDVMQAMHDKMKAAKSPEQRSVLMTEHMKVMQDGMAMMGEMGPGGMMGKGGMGGMKDKPAMGAAMDEMPEMQDKDPMDGDMGEHHQMMEKRMQMMQSMMQMMMDRMPPASGKS